MPGCACNATASANRNSALRPPRPIPRTVTVVSPPESKTLAGNAGMDQSHLACFPLESIAEDQRGVAGTPGHRGGSFKRVLRSGDHDVPDACQPWVIRLGCLALGLCQPTTDGGRLVDAVFIEDAERVLARGGIRH